MLNLRAWKRKKPLNTNVSGSGIHVSDPLVLEKLKMIQLTDQDLENMVKVKPLVMSISMKWWMNFIEIYLKSMSCGESLSRTARWSACGKHCALM